MDYGVIGAPGIQISITDAVSTYIELSYLMGLENIESNEKQTANNIAYGLTLGLSISPTTY